jgi:hypothetical protein
MADHNAFQRARDELAFAHERKTSLASPFLSALPVTGAAVSVLSSQIGQATVSASDSTAARLDEMQFDLGEGPCWEALGSRQPVLAPDLRANAPSAWPGFVEALRTDPVSGSVAAMFAFPLAIGSLDIGAVDLWATSPGDLSGRQVADASALATLAAWQVLRRVLADVPELETPGESIGSRREIHQATGMVLAQLDIAIDDAALLLRAHAYATSRSVGAVANDVVERRLFFSENRPGHHRSGE